MNQITPFEEFYFRKKLILTYEEQIIINDLLYNDYKCIYIATKLMQVRKEVRDIYLEYILSNYETIKLVVNIREEKV